MEFELIEHDLADTIRRTRIPWGWLVMTTSEVVHDIHGGLNSGWDWRSSMTFVFDPFHWWKVNTK